MKAVFLDEDALVEPGRRLYRLNTENRYYYAIDEGRKPMVRFYNSVTRVLDACTPTSQFLIDWYANKGLESAQNYVRERAHYGTLMHILIGDFLIAGELDLHAIPDVVRSYEAEHLEELRELRYSRKSWERELPKDLISFAKFASDANLKPIAIEIVLSSEQDGTAGAVDLVCEMDIEEKGFFGEKYKTGPRKGQPKEGKRKRRIIAIVDFKSNRKGFFDDHVFQVHMYLRIWEENYPDIKVEGVYNWSPKGWRTNPDYHLTDQTNNKLKLQVPMIIELGRLRCPYKPTPRQETVGTIELGKDPKKNIVSVDFEKYLEGHHEGQDSQGAE